VKIKSVETQLAKLPILKGVWGDAIYRTTHIEMMVLDLTTDTGLTGTGFTYTSGVGTTALKAIVDRDLTPHVLGAEVSPRALWHQCNSRLYWISRGGASTTALAALDIALWDLVAKEARLPLTKILGGPLHECLPAYASGINLHMSVDEFVAQVSGWLSDGFRAFKVKVGKPDIEEDVERLIKLRKVMGRHPLMVDANQGWDLPTATRAINAFEPLSLHWVEEPLQADDVVGHQRLKQAVRTPLAIGENIYTIQQFNDFLSRGAVDYVQADLCRVGGITPYLEIAALARAWNVPLAPHFMMEITGQVLCCLPNAHILESIDGGSLADLRAITEPIRIVDGYYVPPQRIGHGIEFDRAYLKTHRLV
jgi:L-alanine-DL-glutamate epimerase-like enolase superfamily enzyme